MNASWNTSKNRSVPRQTVPGRKSGRRNSATRPVAAFRQRGIGGVGQKSPFFAQEDWHEVESNRETRIVWQAPGSGFVHPVTEAEVCQRLSELPRHIAARIGVVQFSRMTRKRKLYPCYGMQWGPNVYLYPIEASLIETYIRPPTPQQLVEARMYGGKWSERGGEWKLSWTRDSLRDFYLNNVLIHEIGHILDTRNTRTEDRERYANWFAVEYGYRASRGRV